MINWLLALGAAGMAAAARGTCTIAHQRLVHVGRLFNSPLILEWRRVDVQVRFVRRFHIIRRLGVVSLLAISTVASRVYVIAG